MKKIVKLDEEEDLKFIQVVKIIKIFGFYRSQHLKGFISSKRSP